MRNVGERLRRFREERGYAAEDVARFTGLTESTVLSYEETERIPGRTALKKLSQLYGITEVELLSGEKEKTWHDGSEMSSLYLLSSLCGYLRADAASLRDDGDSLDADLKESVLWTLGKTLRELSDLLSLSDDEALSGLEDTLSLLESLNELFRIKKDPEERETAKGIASDAVKRIDRIIYGERSGYGDHQQSE